MKYVVIILVSLLTEHSHAQDLISVANTFLNDKNYLEAKAAIDEAFESDQADENPRAWYTKARIYHEILKSTDQALKEIKSDQKAFVAEVVDAYQNTKRLTDPTNNLHILANNQIEILWADYVNAGITKFQSSKFIEASEFFEVSQIAKPADSTGYLYAALSLQNSGKYQRAIDNYMALRDISRLTKNAYNGLIICQQLLNLPDAQQLDVVEEALFEYPNHLPYILQEIRILIRLKRFDAAESVLKTSIQRNPNNAQLVLRQADLYDRVFKDAYLNGEPERSEQYFEMASRSYERYLNSFPEDFTANYNYSVMINEQANRVYVRVNLMSKEEYEMRGKETEQLGHDWTRRALPYMEKAQQAKPEDENVIKALKVYYERLEMTEKLNQINGGN
ncbi:hypothetical protein AWW68_04095 [Roseivirga spongicola]|uniref:Uncharacterized protein n=1 Tax=Roseivirga spongicola TaxID=333140 RepID=A0A150XGX9_9BACT|nr:hypothetical protein [Roseivirga spongicola]KYG77958.1 hypothetical protein AWW68_04095 [Roseivirga spongicola]